MDQTLLTQQQLFFMKLKNSFFPVKIIFLQTHMTIHSDNSQTFQIPYKHMFAIKTHPPQTYQDLNIYSLTIHFYQTYKQGFIFKCQANKLSKLVLYSQDQNKISIWNHIFQYLTYKSELEQEVMELIKSQSIDIKDFKDLQILDEKITSQEEAKELDSLKSFKNAKNFLVFVNPAGGKGLACQIWDQALEVFSKTSHTFEVIKTKYQNHCAEYLKSIKLEDLLEFDGILTVSGDGLPHEVVNALFSREDWKQAGQVPIGVLPGGSGNAMATTLAKKSELNVGVWENALLIAKGHVREMDLMLFQIENKRIYSFLSLTWAYLADVDLNSENLRFLGDARFEVYGTWRALFQKSYQANLSFTKDQIDTSQIQKDQSFFNENVQWEQLNNEQFTYFLIANQPHLSVNYYGSPFSEIDDGYMDLQYLRRAEGWQQLEGKHVDHEKKCVLQGKKWIYEKIRGFKLEPYSNCFYSIDGEKYEPKPIEGIVLGKSLKVFCI